MSSKSKKCRVCRPQTKSSVLPLGTAYDQLSWQSDFTTSSLAGRGLRCVNGHEWKTVVEATTVWRTGGEGRGWGHLGEQPQATSRSGAAVCMPGEGWPRWGRGWERPRLSSGAFRCGRISWRTFNAIIGGTPLIHFILSLSLWWLILGLIAMPANE